MTALTADFGFNWCRTGESFNRCPVPAVQEFLRKRKLEALREHTRNLEIVITDSGAALRMNGSSADCFPLRQSFFDKLMRWYQFPLQALHRMELDEVLPLMNAVLRLIAKPVVIYIEDGEALTIVSTRFLHVPDAMLLSVRQSDSSLLVTRTDHFMHLFGEEISKVEVQPGDIVGIGSSVVNSETGFNALSVGWYLMRLVCSNGAVVPISLFHNKIYHSNESSVRIHVDKALDQLNEASGKSGDVIRLLRRSLKAENPPRAFAEQGLNPLIGYWNAKELLDAQYDDRSAKLFDLFNRVTYSAKRQPPRIRLAMEELAGSWLWHGEEIPSTRQASG